MLTITLLRPTVLTLHAGHVFVLHDPLGLTGERLLGHLHRALAAQPAPPAPTCRWVTVRAPLARVWTEAQHLAERPVWRAPRRTRSAAGWGADAPRSSAGRVAEPTVPDAWPGTHTPSTLGAAQGWRLESPSEHPWPTSVATPAPHVLLLSESDRPDALAPLAAARLVVRAARQGWATFAATRQGAAEATGDAWRTHLVCRRGALHPITGRAGD